MPVTVALSARGAQPCVVHDGNGDGEDIDK